jgi:hypothetical protein
MVLSNHWRINVWWSGRHIVYHIWVGRLRPFYGFSSLWTEVSVCKKYWNVKETTAIRKYFVKRKQQSLDSMVSYITTRKCKKSKISDSKFVAGKTKVKIFCWIFISEKHWKSIKHAVHNPLGFNEACAVSNRVRFHSWMTQHTRGKIMSVHVQSCWVFSLCFFSCCVRVCMEEINSCNTHPDFLQIVYGINFGTKS